MFKDGDKIECVDGEKKSELSRLARFYDQLSDLCDVLQFGEEKYKNDLNWQTYSADLDIDAALRHIMKFKGVEQLDPETQKSHLIHAITRLFFAAAKQEK